MFKATILGLLILCTQTFLFADTPVQVIKNDPTTVPPAAIKIVLERTLAIIKPDAVQSNHIGDIIARFEKGGMKVIALKMTHLTQAQAQQFYNIHKERNFYNTLVTFMSSGPIVALVLEGEQAVAKNREIIGATDPKIAAPGTIRADFARSMTENAVHGSDTPDNAKNEIAFFFKPQEIFPIIQK